MIIKGYLLSLQDPQAVSISCGMSLKALFLSLHQISPQQLHHHLRLCLPLLTLKLLLHSL
jgi:hypothetical protein